VEQAFVSTYVNKVDRKGRVSVPATFRAILDRQRFHGVVVFPSFKYAAIDGVGNDRLDEMQQQIEKLDWFSDKAENLSMLFADTARLPFDGEGRIVLPDTLKAHAHIGEDAAFVGLGPMFQIWEPQLFAEHRAAILARAREQKTTLSPVVAPASGAPQ
jgi:MraZ protein